jgi:virulence factor Mce-like protein
VYVAAFGGIAAFLGLMYLALTAQRGLPVRSYYNLTAEFRDAAHLGRFSEVRIAGKRVGQVVSLTSRDGVAHVELQLAPGQDPLPVDSAARIRLKGLLGAKFIDVVPGHDTRTLPNDGTIPVGQTSTTVDLIDTLQTFDARRRAELRTTVRTLGAGLVTRGDDLNGALHDAPVVLRDGAAVADAITAHTGAARRLVPSLDATVRALDPVREQFAHGLDPAARSLAPFVARRADVQSALDVAPGALATVRQGLARTDPLLAETAGFARAAARLTRPAPGALRSATALLRASPAPLRTTRVLLRRLEAAVAPTLRFTGAVDPLIAPLIRLLRNSDAPVKTLGAYRCDVVGQLRNWRSALAFGPGSSGGPIGLVTMIRIELAGTPDLVGDVPAKPASVVGRNPYAAPCQSITERTP